MTLPLLLQVPCERLLQAQKFNEAPTAWTLAPCPFLLEVPFRNIKNHWQLVQELDQFNVVSCFISSYCYDDAIGGNLRANFAQPLMYIILHMTGIIFEYHINT